jgi:hypothetical protein
MTLEKPEFELGFVFFNLCTRGTAKLHLVPNLAWQCMKRPQVEVQFEIRPKPEFGGFFFSTLGDVIELHSAPRVIQ